MILRDWLDCTVHTTSNFKTDSSAWSIKKGSVTSERIMAYNDVKPLTTLREIPFEGLTSFFLSTALGP